MTDYQEMIEAQARRRFAWSVIRWAMFLLFLAAAGLAYWART
jgi:hypothetical protein